MDAGSGGSSVAVLFRDPDIERDFQAIHALVSKPVSSEPEIADVLGALYATILAFDLDHYDLDELRARGPELIDYLFRLRAALLDRVPGWHKRGVMSPAVQAKLRDVVRASRFAGDMLGELVNGHQRLAASEPTARAFTELGHNLFIHPRFDTGLAVPFEAGDVLLVRGMRHNSAAIARIGDVDSHFSHVCMIDVLDNGQPVVVEALIEEGAKVNTLDYVLSHGLGRAALYRHTNRDLARRAARAIRSHVEKSTSGRIPHIPYDFTMRLKGTKELFCSKLIRFAFELASDGKVLLPTYPTRLAMKNRDFFRRIGVKSAETFSPGDVELEPEFRLVAEWHDYRVTADLRMQDMMMESMFAWMDADGWRFREDFKIKLIGLFGRASTRLSSRVQDLISSVVPKIPPNMRRRTIQTIAMLHETGETMMARLREAERAQLIGSGRPLHPNRILAVLADIRAQANGRIGYLKLKR